MKTTNYIMASVFTVIGLAALFAALFLGATHQFLMAVIGFGMAIVLIAENKGSQNSF